MKQYKTIYIQQKTPNSKVFNLYINILSKFNAFPYDFFAEFPDAISSLDQNPDCHVIVLSGAGDHFCSGADLKVVLLKYLAAEQVAGFSTTTEKTSNANELLRREIKLLQESYSAVERCRKPVIASIHGQCVGGAFDIIIACDIRYCTQDSVFILKHVDSGFTNDIGTLQRLPAIVGYGNAVEMALTCRKVSGQDAKDMGLVSRVFQSKQALDEGVGIIAEGIAAKSPIAVVGTKTVLQQFVVLVI